MTENGDQNRITRSHGELPDDPGDHELENEAIDPGYGPDTNDQ